VFGTLALDRILGLTWLDGALFGFAYDGTILELDPATGQTVRSEPSGILWAGAATTF
jgi:hypothetical protein